MRRRAQVYLLALLAACTTGQPADTSPPTTTTIPVEARSGGDATVFDTSSSAFGLALPTLSPLERRAFAVGNNFFNDNWVTAPASTDGRDGLGPVFNAQSCSSCHFRDGRGRPPEDDEDPERGMLLRLSVPGVGGHGEPLPDPVYGGQLQDRAINGVLPEGMIRILEELVDHPYPDGTTATLSAPTHLIADPAYGPVTAELFSPRVAPPIHGGGLLEAVTEEEILSAADPRDSDGDGVSGRPNRVWEIATGDRKLGRFGWKANVPTLEQQVASAFEGDIGITSSLFPEQPCTPTQRACVEAPTGGDPELDDNKLERVTFYSSALAVPARRDLDDPVVQEGEALFATVGCTACHRDTLRTGDAAIEGLASQVIHPYTDLLLHDMGEGLADGRPDFEASGSEWRTPPLWGIGLTEVVSGHTRFLHDGRARSLEEAILWHGGEADGARTRFEALTAEQRAALLAFLESL